MACIIVSTSLFGVASPLNLGASVRSTAGVHSSTPLRAKPGKRRLYATSEDNQSVSEQTKDEKENSATSSFRDRKAEEKETVKKGQTTAVVTGAIAVMLGVAYLVLVQLLDSRGVNLVPPPPEAFEM